MSYDPRYSGRGRGGGGGDRGGRGGGRGGRGGGGGGGEGCFKCGQKGHFARECPNPPTSGAGGRGGGGRGGGRGGGAGGRGGQQQRTPASTSTSTSTSRPTSASTSTSTSSPAWGSRATSSPTIATSSSPSLSSSMSTLSIEGFHDIEVPEELETKSESATSEEDLKMSMPLTEAELIPRLPPAKNTKMTVTLMTNFFHVNFANKTIYSHLVKFEPELQPKQLMERRRTVASFGKEIREKYGKFIFDGSTQILNLKPVSDASEFEHKNADGTSTKIYITHIKPIPTSDYKSPEVDMVVNILFKQQLREIKLMQFGRAYFYPEPMKLPQNYPIDMFRGFQAAINPTLTGLQLCVDLSHKVIQRRNVRHMMTEIEQQVQTDYRGQPQAMIYTEIVDRVNRELKGTMVVAKYNQRNWRIDAIDYKKTMDDTFVLKDGTTISFRNYYLKTYPDSPEVQYLKTAKASPGLLMNIQKNKGKKSQGEILNSSYLIPELCYLTGITDAQRTDTRLMKILASETRKGPSERVDSISKLILDIVNKQKSLKDQTFPLGIEMNATSVQARILDGFAITFANQQPHRVVAGNASSTGFQRAVMNAGCMNVTGGKSEIKKIGFLGEIEYDKDFRDWAQDFSRHAHRCNTPVNGIYHVVVKVTGGMSKPQRIQAWSEAIRQAAQQKPECLVCLIANADESIYSFIKHYTTSQLGIITQCIQSDSIYSEKLYMPIIGNSFKQLMAKMNYMLWNIDLKQVVHSSPNAHNPNTMFVGLDVCHDKKTKNAYKPTTESFTRSASPCSTVGFVASLGKDINQYYSQIAIQGRYEEYVRTSRDLMINSLRQYHTRNGKFPDRVVVYRDGVGNSQLESFVRKEVREYEYAFTEMKCQPKLTVIVVQKRIPVRFFSTCEYYASNQRCSTLGDRCKGDQPCHSPIPGTCVDTDVVSQLFSDFYLIPSISPPGATSRPTRFIIIRDENHFTSDDIQNMTNSLCYMYYNWPGPIRVPSMCMYAHKIAYLFGKYVHGEPHDTMKNKLFYL